MAIDRNAIIKEAQKFAAKGMFDKAIAEWNKIARDTPKDANVFNSIGDLCLKKNSKPEAVVAYHKAADLLAADGFTSKAIALYKKVLNIDPKKMAVHLALADLNAEKGLVGNALESYKIVADHYIRNKETNKALDIYQKMADLNSSNINFRIKLAEMYTKEGMGAEAVKAYLQAADFHISKEAFNDARKLFEKALALDSGNKDVYHKAGLVYFKEGKFAEACKALKSVFENAPENAEVAELYVDALTKSGQGEEAAGIYEQILAADPARNDLREKLYQMYLSEKNLDKAFTEVSTLVNGRIESKDFNGAETLLRAFLAEAPESADGRRALSAVYKATGKADEAANQLVLAAHALLNDGNDGDAEDVLKKALDLAPGNAAAEKMLQGMQAPAAQPEPEPAPFRKQSPAATVSKPQQRVSPLPPEPELIFEPEPEELPPPLLEEAIEWVPPSVEPEPEEQPEIPAPQPEAWAPAAAPAVPQLPAEESEVIEAIAEIDVLVKYGLATKAVEQLEALANRFPESMQVRIKLRDLYGDMGNMSKAVNHMLVLADLYERIGDQDQVDHILDAARQMDPANAGLQARGLAPGAPLPATVEAAGVPFESEAEIREPDQPEEMMEAFTFPAAEEEQDVFLQEPSAEEDISFDNQFGVELPAEDEPVRDIPSEPQFIADLNPEATPEEEPLPPPVPYLPAARKPEKQQVSQPQPAPQREPVAERPVPFVPEQSRPAPQREPVAERPVPFVPEQSRPAPQREPVAERPVPFVPEQSRPAPRRERAPEIPVPSVPEQPQPAPEAVDVGELLAEAEFYYQQGLFEEARKYYEEIIQHAPDNVQAQTRLDEISKDQEDSREFSKIAEVVDGMADLDAFGGPTGLSGNEMASSPSDDEAVRQLMQEISQLKQKAAPPPEKNQPVAPKKQTPAPAKAMAVTPPADEDFFDLGAELDEVGSSSSPQTKVDSSGKADDFFDLASELRDELKSVPAPVSGAAPAEEQSLDDIFEEFKRGVEQQAVREDVDTHYNLGVAYKEMGLLEDAIAEFILTPEDEPKYILSRYMLGLCYLQQGDYQNAIVELQNSLSYADASGVPAEEHLGMWYDLGLAHQGAGDNESALKEFQKAYAQDRNFRDVAHKIQELKKGGYVSMEQLKDDIEREISSKFLAEGERIQREEKTRKSEKVRQ